MKKKILSFILAIAMVVSLFTGMTMTAGAEGATIQAFTGVELNGTTVTLTLDSSKTYRVETDEIEDYMDDLTRFENEVTEATAMVDQPVLTSSEEIESNWKYGSVKTFANMSTYNSGDVTVTGKSSYTIELDVKTLVRVFEVDPDVYWDNSAGSTLRPVLAAYGAILIPVFPDIESVRFTTNWSAMPTMKDGGDFPFSMMMGFMPPVLPDNQNIFAEPFMSVKVTADNITNVVNSDFLELIDPQDIMSNADLLAAYKAFVTEEEYTAYPDWVSVGVLHYPDSGEPIPAINTEYKVNTTDEYALFIYAMTDKNNFSGNVAVTLDNVAVNNVYRYTDEGTCKTIAFVHELGKLSAFVNKLPVRYEVTWVEESEGGEVNVYPANGMAAEGETVNLDISAYNGYVLESVKVYKTDGDTLVSTVELDKWGEGSFTMPAYAVTVKATFVPEDGGTTWYYSQLKNYDILKSGDVVVNDLGAGNKAMLNVADHNYEHKVNISENSSVTLGNSYRTDFTGVAPNYDIKSEEWVVMISYPYPNPETQELGAPRVNLVKTADANWVELIGLSFQQNADNYNVTITDKDSDYIYVNMGFEDLYNAGLETYTKRLNQMTFMNDLVSKTVQVTQNVESEDVLSQRVIAGDSFTVPSCGVGYIQKLKKVESVEGKAYNYLVVGAAYYSTDRIVRNINIESATNGTITAAVNGAPVATAKEMDTVSLTVTPASGYALQSLTVKDAAGNEVLLEDGNFVMPKSNVTVTATFVELGDGHFHCVCDSSNSCGESHNAATEWEAWESATSLPTNAGCYYLATDVTLQPGEVWAPPAGTALCLNGHVVKSSNNECVIIEVTSGEFILTDCKDTEHKFTVDSDGLWVLDETNGTKTVNGGVITGGGNSGVFVAGSGDFTMYSGNIVGNKAGYRGGGGIRADGGTVTIFGGTICGNCSDGQMGGGIFGEDDATINVYGGTITENVTNWLGGGGIGTFNSTLNVQGAPVIKDNKLKVSNSSDPELSAVSESAPAFDESNVKISAAMGSEEEPQADQSKINITGALHRDAEIGVTVGNDSFFTNGWSAHMVNRDPGEYFFADEANGFEDLIPFEGSTDPYDELAAVELRLVQLDNNNIILDDEYYPMDGGGEVTAVYIDLSKSKTFDKLTNGEALPALEGTPVPEDPEVEIPEGFKMGFVSASVQTSKDVELDYTKASIVSEWMYVEPADLNGVMNGTSNAFKTPTDDYKVNNKDAYFIKTTIIAPVTFDAKSFTDMMELQLANLVYLYEASGAEGLAPVRLSVEGNRITVIFTDAMSLPGGDDTPDTPVVPEYPYIPPVIPVTPPTVDVPVSNDENKVDVKAEVSGNDATIKPLDEEQIEQLVGDTAAAGDVVIDLTEMGKEINTAGIPKETLEAIVNAAENAENNTEHLVIKLSTAQLTLDDTAMRAIVDQADGDVIKFNFDDVGLGRLNKEQKEAVKDMDVRKGYEAYITVNGERVSDFNGGNVEIIVPYAVPADENIAGFSVWYIDEDGKPEKQKSTYDGKNKCFVVTHFSDYVIVYDEEDAQAGNYRVCLKDETCPIHDYTDASANAWYHNGVHYCIENGLMSGMGDNLFAPNGATTRAQIVNVLWRLEGKPVVNYAMSYTDVVADKWYTEAVRWATAEGIVLGYSDTVFAPNIAITREQMAAILWRYCKYKGIDVSVGENTNILSYSDAFDISGWAIPAMQWACGADVINGIADGDSMKLDPAGNAARAQVATMLQRFCVEILGA